MGCVVVRNLPASMQRGDGFEIETLMNVRVARAAASIIEVGSTEKARLHGVSNLRAIPDGIRVLHTVLAERRRLRRKGRDAIADEATVDESLFGEST